MSNSTEIELEQSRQSIERGVRQGLVLKAARQVIAAKGIDATRMEDIAVAAKYTRRTLYVYFKSRDDLLLLLFAEDLAQRRERQEVRVAQVEGGLERLLAWGRAYMEHVMETPQSWALQRYWDYTGIVETRFSDEALERFEHVNNALANDLREMFQQGVEDGSLRDDLNHDMTISHFLYSLRAIFDRARSSTYSFASFEPEEYVDRFLELFSRGIRRDHP